MALQKHIFDHMRLKAEEFVEAELFRQYGTDPDKMVSALQREAMIALKIVEFFQQIKQQQSELSGENQPQPPDPLIELKKQELSQNAQRDQGRLQIDQSKLQLDQQQEQNDVTEAQARLNSQQQIASNRDQLAMMKMSNGATNVQ